MKLTIVGATLLVAGGAAVLTGLLPVSDLLMIADRVWPILLFVVAVTVVAELAAAAGVFDVAAYQLARAARGRTVTLWLLVVLLAVATTMFLSLDTTAVLLTPVVIAMARAHRLNPLPFVFTTVWLANTASLLLPVSNLTNLLAVSRIGDGSVGAFVSLLLPSALVSIGVSTLLLAALHWRSIRGCHAPAAAPDVADILQLRVAAVIVVALLPMLVSGIPPWLPASVAAIALVLLFAWRSPRVIGLPLIPWSLLLFAGGLFVTVGALEAAGSGAVLAMLAGRGSAPVDILRLAGSSLIAANIGNNLPAYLALESVAGSSQRLGALLIGVNAGPLITPWASLATLLWHARIASAGIEMSWGRFVLFGAVAAPATVLAATVPLMLGGLQS